MKVLIAGSDAGIEFGWLLMKWIPKLRYLKDKYDKVFVVTRVENMFLYQDFAEPIHEYTKLNNIKDRWRYQGLDIDYINPHKEFFRDDNKYPCKHLNYKMVNSKYQNVILIHPRKKNDSREWSAEKWKELIQKLAQINIECWTIGEKKYTYDVYEYGSSRDYRDMFLKSLVYLLNQSKLIVGPSSGPMHLASLCGCSHLVWTDDKVWDLGHKKGTNRERYEKEWNPFNTKVTVIDQYGWDPPVDVVFENIKKVLGIVV